MVRAEDVISIYQCLLGNGIRVWLTGGWGIDALLGRQTRPHKDLDVLVLLDDVIRMRALMAADGYGLKELWSENRFVVDGDGVETATAFVLQDPSGRELDVHAMRVDEQGNGMPAWEAEGLILGSQDLAGKGVIDGTDVRCLSVEMQLLVHTGYELPEVQLRDLELLHREFGVELPDDLSRLRPLWVQGASLCAAGPSQLLEPTGIPIVPGVDCVLPPSSQ